MLTKINKYCNKLDQKVFNVERNISVKLVLKLVTSSVHDKCLLEQAKLVLTCVSEDLLEPGTTSTSLLYSSVISSDNLHMELSVVIVAASLSGPF